jgi:hypothetical protein
MTMKDHWTDRLSEYLDGDLAERERRQLEVHLQSCAECSATLAELESVVTRARDLVHDAPAEDLWPGIAARIAAPERREIAPGWWRRQLTLSLPQAVAAGLALVLLSTATMWMLGRAPMPVTRGPSVAERPPITGGDGPAAPSRIAAGRGRGASENRSGAPQRRATATPGPETVEVASIDPQYEATIASLERSLEQERARLDPSTVQVLERNLEIIDRALADARRAVAADPSNFYLRDHLARVMRQKVNLLLVATSIAGDQG